MTLLKPCLSYLLLSRKASFTPSQQMNKIEKYYAVVYTSTLAVSAFYNTILVLLLSFTKFTS